MCVKWQWNALDWCYWIAQSINTVSGVSLSFCTHPCVLAILQHICWSFTCFGVNNRKVCEIVAINRAFSLIQTPNFKIINKILSLNLINQIMHRCVQDTQAICPVGLNGCQRIGTTVPYQLCQCNAFIYCSGLKNSMICTFITTGFHRYIISANCIANFICHELWFFKVKCNNWYIHPLDPFLSSAPVHILSTVLGTIFWTRRS